MHNLTNNVIYNTFVLFFNYCQNLGIYHSDIYNNAFSKLIKRQYLLCLLFTVLYIKQHLQLNEFFSNSVDHSYQLHGLLPKLNMAAMTGIYKFLKDLFSLGCLVAFVYLLISCICEYHLDKDVSSVKFKKFHYSQDQIYPSVSLCFSPVFNHSTEDINSNDYINFLSGCRKDNHCKWNRSYSELQFDDLTKNLFDYIYGEKTIFADQDHDTFFYKSLSFFNMEQNGKLPKSNPMPDRIYISQRSWNEKCITFDMPYYKEKQIKFHSILMNNDIFPNRIRPMIGKFSVSFHYPKQNLIRTSVKILWTNDALLLKQSCLDGDNESKSCGTSYTMNFEVGNVSILKRRRKPKSPCIANWKNYDNEFRSRIAKKLECKPTHWNLDLNLTKCSSKEQMNAAWKYERNASMPSCQNIERYVASYSENPDLVLFSNNHGTYGNNFSMIPMEKKILSEILIHFPGNINLHFESVIKQM